MRSRHAFVIAIAVAGVLFTWQARTERAVDADRRADDSRERRKGPPTTLGQTSEETKGPRTYKILRGATAPGARQCSMNIAFANYS